jgi:hypothetical protein
MKKPLIFFCIVTVLKVQSISGQDQAQILMDKATENPRSMTQQEWKSILSPTVFHVTREKGTEARFSSPLYKNPESGNYVLKFCQ